MKQMQLIRLLFTVALLMAVPASGQMLRGHNSKAPVDFDADRIEVQDRSDRVVLSGNVRVNQAGMTLDAARLTVAYAKQGGSSVDVERLDASGGVVVRSSGDVARGSFAVYDLNRSLITLVGGVELNQNGNVVRGGRLVIDLNSGRAVIDGGAVGGAAPGASSGRVSGRFTVSQKN
jgi:lipopolysaccharide export system protein LptA